MISVATAPAWVKSLVADYPEDLPVLVVDDDADIRLSISRYLQKYKIKVVESGTLREARDRFRAGEEFSLV
ncbi:MAG TPA: hypothetical protein VF251_03045, partial [Pyrinomonadaceae bacterium]